MADEPTPAPVAAAPPPTPAPTPPAPAASPEAAPPAAGTEPPKAWFPDDWRAKLAGEDKSDLKSLAFMDTPEKVWKSYKELRAKVSSGEMRTAAPFPDKGTDEEKAAWRTDRNLPAKWEDYKPDLPNGVVLADHDKPMAESFAQWVHQRNWSPQQYSEALGWYYDALDKLDNQAKESDATFATESDAKLKAAWGQDYTKNKTAIAHFLADKPKEFQDRLFQGRTADGKRFADDPEIQNWLAQTALKTINPHTLVPAGASRGGAGDELTQIKKIRTETPGKYWADKQLQARERELIAMRDNKAA